MVRENDGVVNVAGSMRPRRAGLCLFDYRPGKGHNRVRSRVGDSHRGPGASERHRHRAVQGRRRLDEGHEVELKELSARTRCSEWRGRDPR
jgi:hypothetical protein